MSNRSQNLLVALAVLGGLFLASSPSSAATCTLVPKKIESTARGSRPDLSTPDWLFAATGSQNFYVNFQPKETVKDGKKVKTWTMRQNRSQRRRFNKLVEKQPEKYNSKQPFRGIAKLGDKQYGLVLDTLDADSQSYGLLYFDVNGNGDLTDDGVIESFETQRVREAREKAEKEAAKREQEAAAAQDKTKEEKKEEKKKPKVARTPRYPTTHRFPRIDLKIEIDGKEVDYSFLLSSYAYFRRNYGYVGASLKSGVYYDGEIELDGRKRRVVLVDYNSNGRFGDKTKILKYGRAGKGPKRLYPRRGDVLFVDPKPVSNRRAAWNFTGLDFRHSVEKLICLDGRYYDLEVAPSGNELVMEPSAVPIGSVTNPNANYKAVIHGPQGVIQIKGTKDQPVPLPEGKWKLLSYTIDLTGVKPAEDKQAEKKKKEKTAAKGKQKTASLWTAIGKAVAEAAGAKASARPAPGRPKTTLASGTGTTAGKSVEVRKGHTVLLPFGPPYKTTVEPSYFRSNTDRLYLGLVITGSGGELLTSLRVNGNRPAKPTIKILDPEGEVVNRGNFEYG